VHDHLNIQQRIQRQKNNENSDSRNILKRIDRFTPGLYVFVSFMAALTLLLSVPSATFAGSATWELNPGSGDWNTAANWTPATVPTGSTDTATFALSNTTALSVSANATVDGITFSPGASSFTITPSPGFILNLSGAGITNNSGTTQNFVTAVDGPGNFGTIAFINSATAGSLSNFTNNGGGGNTSFF